MNLAKVRDDGLVTPSEALALIVHYVGTEYIAKQVIGDGLYCNKITTVADLVWETDLGDISDEWIPRRFLDNMYEEDVELEPGCFAGSAQWPAEMVHWRWDTGDFVLFLSDPDADRLTRIHMRGVQFVRKDILALVGRNNRKGAGGPKPDRERWTEFWISVLYGVSKESFDWTQFDNPHQLKVQLQKWSDDLWTDNNLDGVVSDVWKGLVQRCAAERKHGRVSDE